ncbi:MAG: hypothetical protein SGPRY_000852 [Prymnesium sp.]
MSALGYVFMALDLSVLWPKEWLIGLQERPRRASRLRRQRLQKPSLTQFTCSSVFAAPTSRTRGESAV